MYIKFKGDHPVYPPQNQDEDIVEQLARGIEYHDPSCENQSDPRRNEQGTLGGTIGHTDKCLARFYAAEHLRNLEIELHNTQVRRARENDAWHKTMTELDEDLLLIEELRHGLDKKWTTTPEGRIALAKVEKFLNKE